MEGMIPDDHIARLVRAALEADARSVDTVRMQSQICERLAEQGQALAREEPARKSLAALLLRKPLRISLVAACLLVAGGFAVYLFVSTSPVQAVALVQSARLTLDSSADREYRVTFERSDNLPFLSSVDEARLWTRGDRFRVTFHRGEKSVLWGQDEQQRLWVAAARDKGLSFEAEEIPREVAGMLSYLSLDIKHMTDQILENCELTISEGMRNRRKGVTTVQATAKQGGKLVEFSTAELDIDEDTKVIRRLQLTRRVNGVDHGRCLLTLVDDRLQSDESYRLSTYLEEGAEVLDKTRYQDRMVDLFRVIREFNKKK